MELYIRGCRPGEKRLRRNRNEDRITGVRSIREVAKIIGCTPQNILIIEHKALRKMRSEWERLFGQCDSGGRD